jgi:ABC-2 type transport system permease protein
MTWVNHLRNSRLLPMVRKEFIQMRRDRMTLGMLVGVPAMYILLFGFAVRTEVRHLPTVVLDESGTQESRALVSVLEQTQNFRITGSVADREALRREIESGRAQAGIVIPPGFTRDFKRGATAEAQVIIDAANPMASSAAISGASLTAQVLPGKLAPEAAGGAPRVDLKVRPWYNPALKDSWFIVPGTGGLMLTLTLLVVMAMALVREREHGTMEQLVVTPIGKLDLMLGKVVPFMVIGYLQITSVLFFSWLFFSVPFRGNLLQFYLLSAPFIFANLGLGLLISTMAKTQAAAQMMATMFLVPSILLSGFMFPREAMPAFAMWIGNFVPLTYYLEIIRGVMLKGVGFESLWQPTLALTLFAILALGISTRRFAKTVE